MTVDFPMTWVGVRDYVGADGRVQRHLHRPEQVTAPGFVATLPRLPVVPSHPPPGVTVRVGGGEGTLPAEELLWGTVSDRVEPRRLPYLGGVDVPVASVTFYDARAIARLRAGIVQSSLGYDAWVVKAPPGSVWTAPDGTTHAYDYEHILDPRDAIVLEAVRARRLDSEGLGGNHFAAPIPAGRGGAASSILQDAEGPSPSPPGVAGVFFYADDSSLGAAPTGGGLPAGVACALQAFAGAGIMGVVAPDLAAALQAVPRTILVGDPVWASYSEGPYGVTLWATSGDGLYWSAFSGAVAVVPGVSVPAEVEAAWPAQPGPEPEPTVAVEVEAEVEVSFGPPAASPAAWGAADAAAAIFCGGDPRARYNHGMKVQVPHNFRSPGSSQFQDAQISIDLGTDDPTVLASIAATLREGAARIEEARAELEQAQAQAQAATQAATVAEGQVTELQGQMEELQADAAAGREAVLREVRALADAHGVQIPAGASPNEARLAFLRARCPSAVAHLGALSDAAEIRKNAPAIQAAYNVVAVLGARPSTERPAAAATRARPHDATTPLSNGEPAAAPATPIRSRAALAARSIS